MYEKSSDNLAQPYRRGRSKTSDLSCEHVDKSNFAQNDRRVLSRICHLCVRFHLVMIVQWISIRLGERLRFRHISVLSSALRRARRPSSVSSEVLCGFLNFAAVLFRSSGQRSRRKITATARRHRARDPRLPAQILLKRWLQLLALGYNGVGARPPGGGCRKSLACQLQEIVPNIIE